MLTKKIDLNESMERIIQSNLCYYRKAWFNCKLKISEFNIWDLVINPKPNFCDFLGKENFGL